MFGQNQQQPDPSALIGLGIAFFFGALAYGIAKISGPIFPIMLCGIYVSSIATSKELPLKIGLGISAIELLLTPFVGWQNFWSYNLILGLVLAVIPERLVSGVVRGSQLQTPIQLQKQLRHKEQLMQRKQQTPPPILPKLEIADIQLPDDLAPLSFMFLGSPGSGKTQAILKMLSIMRERPDYRVICLDRSGEILEKFADHNTLIYNPRDKRTVHWSHRSEGIDFETIAAGLIPPNPDAKDPFWNEAAKGLLSDLYAQTYDNAEVWEMIAKRPLQDLKDLLTGTLSATYLEAENTAAGIKSSAINYLRFYKVLADNQAKADFSWSRWGREDDKRWIFLPIFENEAELFKPLYTMAFSLMLRGLLSNENHHIKTVICIDELSALGKLVGLERLLAEGRKFSGIGMLGTQLTGQIANIYGEYGMQTILQGCCTKLILNCRDYSTAELCSKLIGGQERLETTQGKSSNGWFSETRSVNQQIRETFAVLPSELQALPPLEGYLLIADGTKPAKVRVTPTDYPLKASRFIDAAI
ncbi:type IV secretion system DNA-binding domain-containing protein [Nostoc sp. PA-18-2419]|uniref:type IV secretion system DNA-binding domain-containing protein n=1 Tax=Nostoc sp. PA-18-2419 TaxID=2575443 RepID=UPI001CB8F668|nr:type IV secretion system DNA-binding domain-containing protein [Nostoc sp. PA-18-2419]